MAHELVEANSVGSGEGRRRRERRGWGWGRRGHDACPAGCDAAVRSEDCPLSEAAVGEAVTVTGLHGDEAFRARLMAMGILPGVTLRVVKGGRRQPLLVALPGCRCMLDQRSSELIAVRGSRSAVKQERTWR